MKPTANRCLAVLLLLMLSLLVVPLAAFATPSGNSASVKASTVGGSVYGDVYGCTPWPAMNDDAWKGVLKSVSVDKGKATFTVPNGYCQKELSFTSYSFPNGVIPNSDGKPFEKQEVYRNVTGMYGPGTHTVNVELPCGYWQTDLYAGAVIPKLNAAYGHPGNLILAWDINEKTNSCVGGGSVGDNVYGGGTVSDGVYGGNSGGNGGVVVVPACTTLTAANSAEWMNLLHPTFVNGKVTFTIPAGSCAKELSLTNYIGSQAAANVTATYAPGTHTAELPYICGNQTAFYAGPQINNINNIAANLQITSEASISNCGSSSDNDSSSGSSSGGGGGGGSSDSGSSTGSTPSGSTGNGTSPTPTTPSDIVNLDETPVPAGAVQMPDQTAPANGTNDSVILDEAMTPLGFATLPQTGESIPWSLYTAGVLMMLLGSVMVWKLRRN